MLQDQLQDILDSFQYLGPELALMGGSIILLLAGLVAKNRWVVPVVFGIVILAALLLFKTVQTPVYLFSDSISSGPLEGIVKLLLIGSTAWIALFPRSGDKPMEFYFLIVGVLVGSLFIIDSNNLLLAYLALELTSFSSYLLTNFDFRKRSFEAGLKYLLFGGVSSAFMLYGMSLLYGLSGTLTLSDFQFEGSDPLLAIASILVFVGLFFKTSIIPFHIWTPGTYEETPTAAVAVLSVVPKLAGFVLLHRLLASLGFPWLDQVILLAGMGTILVGTLGALSQQHIKRLMAYGAIAHSGLLIACLIPSGEIGATAFLWYSLIYAIMNVSLFYFIAVFEESGIQTVKEFRGLGSERPFFGGLFLIVLISLIGLPPTGGFSVKLYLFSALWSEFQAGGDLLILTYLILAILSVVFSLFYYLKIPFHYFISVGNADKIFKPDLLAGFLATISVFVLLWSFFQPDVLNKIADHIKFIAW